MKREYDLKKLRRVKKGPIAKKDTKVVKTIRLDLDIVGWLLQEADLRRVKYQTLINSILREAMQGGGIVLTAEKVREIVRDEIGRKVS